MNQRLERLSSRSKQELGKRKSLLMPATTIATLAAINHFEAKKVWGKTGPTKLDTLSRKENNPSGQPANEATPTANAGWVVFPGMGSFGGEEMANTLAGAVPEGQPYGYLTYDNVKGTKIKDLAKELTDYQKTFGLTHLDIYAPSMGAILALLAAQQANIPIRTFYMNSSPSHIDDTNMGTLGHQILANIPYHGGLAGKFAGTLAVDLAHGGVRNIPKQIRQYTRHAWSETKRGASPQLLKSQMKILKDFDPKDWERFKDIIIPGITKVAYASPPFGSDSVVNVEQAYKGWEMFFSNFGNIPLAYIEMLGAKHADTHSAIKYGRQWLNGEDTPDGQVIFSRKVS